MGELIALSALRPDHLGKIVQVRGIITLAGKNDHIVLQECNYHSGWMPRHIDCFLREGEEAF